MIKKAYSVLEKTSASKKNVMKIREINRRLKRSFFLLSWFRSKPKMNMMNPREENKRSLF
jgi:hypothetical protein